MGGGGSIEGRHLGQQRLGRAADRVTHADLQVATATTNAAAIEDQVAIGAGQAHESVAIATAAGRGCGQTVARR